MDNYDIIRSRSMQIIGWIFLVIGIILFISTSISFFRWMSIQSDYQEVYASNESGSLSYELDGRDYLIKEVLDINGDSYQLNMPDGQTAIFYCQKSQLTTCRYGGNYEDSSVLNLQNPFTSFLVSFFILALAILVISAGRKRNFNAASGAVVFGVCLCLLGIYSAGG